MKTATEIMADYYAQEKPESIYYPSTTAPAQPFVPGGKGCPHCGYCPHCGRTNPTYPSYPYSQPYKYEVTCGQTGVLSGTQCKS